MTSTGLADEHFDKVAHYIAEGELVPLLGVGSIDHVFDGTQGV